MKNLVELSAAAKSAAQKAKEMKKAAEKAQKVAEKAAEGKEKAKAEEAAEVAAKKAEEAKAAEEAAKAEETRAAEQARKEAEEKKAAEEKRAGAIDSLTKKTKEEAKGLNAACRNLKAAAAAKEAAQEERRALLEFAGIVRPEGSPEEISPEEVAAVPNSSIISAYRNNAPYYAEKKAEGEGEARRVIVGKVATENPGLWHIEEAVRFTIEKVFKTPAKRQQKGLKPQALVLGGYYMKGEAAGSLQRISSAEAQALIKEAKEAAAKAAEAKAKAEAQAEADRKRGEALRREDAKAKAAERAAKREAEKEAAEVKA